MYNTTPITGVYASALSALGIEPAAGTQAPIAALDKLCKKAFGGEKADRLLLLYVLVPAEYKHTRICKKIQ